MEPAPNRLRRLLRTLFGELHWSPPGWARALGRPFTGLGAWRRRRPERFRAAIAAALALAVGAIALERWLASRPRPEVLAVTVHEPAPTPLEEDAEPAPLRIAFSGAAAPLERVGAEVSEGFRLEPPLAGTWRWESDRELRFAPAEDWPVGERHVLRLEPGFLASQARLASDRIAFRTPPLGASLASAEFYEDPTDPANKRAVVAIQFTHPVDKASLERRLALRLRVDPETDFDARGARSLPFELAFDETGARAFVRSEPIAIPPKPGAVRVRLEPGVVAARGGAASEARLDAEVAVPGVETYFRVTSVAAGVVTRDDHRMERVATLEFSAPVRVEGLRDKVEVWELPADRPAVGERPAERDFAWRDPAQVVPEVLAQARRIEPAWNPSEPEFAKLQSFRFEATPGRTMYVRIERGATAFGDYALAQPFAALVPVAPWPRAAEILHDGALLALTGGKKLSVLTRNLAAVEIELSRLLPGSVAHVATQTSGRFQEPAWSWSFGVDDVSERFREVRALAPAAPGEPQYTAIDFSRLLASGAAPRGLFQLRVVGWDAQHETRLWEAADTRLVLVTDLGFLVKDAADGSHDVFVVSLATGEPVADADVRILGRNGLPILARRSDAAGRASFPNTDGFEREQAPVSWVVEKEGDLAFLPFGRDDRRLDLSRFDIGGLEADAALEALQGFLFSDRGVYRPGEEVAIGVIVKRDGWQPLPDGLPLEIAVVDPRGLEVRSETLAVPSAGFRDWRFPTLAGSPTGTWQVELWIVRDGERKGLLGRTAVRVEEFLPDRMTIDARLSAPPSPGWIAPADLRARVALRNLFGTPAVGHRVKGRLVLSPAVPAFPRWAEWSFVDPLQAKQGFDETLAELVTDETGAVEFPLDLERFTSATYRLRFLAEGFEAEGGRSVATDASAIVSPHPFLVAWKADGDLGYVKRGTRRAVEVVAVGPALDPVATDAVRAELVELQYVSVLSRQPSGLLAYQSVKKEVPRGATPLALGAEPVALPLPTDAPGRFAYVLRDAAGTELNRIPFEVVGEGNVASRVERNAELRVRLERDDYAPGEEIEVAIQAPYAGAGLVTIERDRVYAAQWFRADGNATVQRIRLPEEVEGNAYVVVSFVRALGSPEIHLSPLSNGAAPFQVSRARRTQALALDVPERVEPGQPLRITWTAPAPTRLAVLAVDEGILQVARWRTPDPLAHFFRKRALAVSTSQILDLLLPEYDVVKALAAPGGDEDAGLAGHLNPFKRRNQAPAAFWSGVLDVPAGPGSLEYVVPDHFSGTLRVVAVAVNETAIGVAEAKALARGPFVLQPTVPTFAAPGDELEVTALVANAIDGSGELPVTIALETSEHVALVGESEQTLAIAEGRDATARFRVRVAGPPGAARFTFRASGGGRSAATHLETSVRPPAPRLTTVTTRVAPRGGEAELPVERELYPELRSVRALAATSPLALVPGLAQYLDEFPHGCTEQVVSQALPGVVLAGQADLGIDPERARTHFERAIAILRARQNGDGAFGLWDADEHTSEWIDAWATHVLLEARARGLAVPDGLWTRALDGLRARLGQDEGSLAELRARAYAGYVLTRAGEVRSDELRALRDALLRGAPDGAWRGDPAALLLAASFSQLQLGDDARALLAGASLATETKPREPEPGDSAYLDPLAVRAIALYLFAQHFPERARAVPPAELLALAEPVAAGRFSTHSSAWLVLALDAWARAVPPADAAVAISWPDGQGTASAANDPAGDARAARPRIASARLPIEARRVRFTGPAGVPLFHQLVETGFDREPPLEAARHGLEVVRELRGPDGAPVTRIGITDAIEVRLRVRSADGAPREVAVVDLLPGGFEVDLGAPGLAERRSLVEGADAWSPAHVEVREDRVVLYGWVGDRAQSFSYRIKPTNRGRVQVPPVLVEGLYDRLSWGRGLGGELVVE